MSPLPSLPINQGRVLSHSVVPHNDCALLPLDPGLEVSAVRQVVIQELQKRIRLFLLQANDFSGDCSPGQYDVIPSSLQWTHSHCGLT